MKVLMFGWEYAPQHTGGLGIACKELSDELSKKHAISFVLPKTDTEINAIESKVTLSDVSEVEDQELELEFEDYKIEFLDIETNLLPYLPPQIFKKEKIISKAKHSKTPSQREILKSIPLTGEYNKNLSAEVTKYTLIASSLYKNQDFDVIHAHDWMGANAGMLAKAILEIPLIVHVHSTEYDRNGIGGNENIKMLEKKAFETADVILSVSQKTKNDIVHFYGIAPEKIRVVSNATRWRTTRPSIIEQKSTKIGFMGRMTHQKAPEKFVDLARLLESSESDFEYLMIGDGYLENHLKHKVKTINLSSRFKFAGFLDQTRLKKTLNELSLLVIPSVSEPFGLVALEATAKGIPVIITENAGVNEFIPFRTFKQWDIHGMSKLALSIIRNPDQAEEYVLSCQKALQKLSWKKSAGIIDKIYRELADQ